MRGWWAPHKPCDPDLLHMEDHLDTRGRAYYWMGTERRRAKPPKGTDLWAVRSNLISVTPLCLDFTDQNVRQRLDTALGAEIKDG